MADLAMPHGASAPEPLTKAQFDTGLAALLAGPSHAHRFLTGVADVLDSDPLLDMHENYLTEALNLSRAYTLAPLARAIATEAAQIAMREMPLAYRGETTGSLALRIRAAAEDIR
jgi:hypothetical protein